MTSLPLGRGKLDNQMPRQSGITSQRHHVRVASRQSDDLQANADLSTQCYRFAKIDVARPVSVEMTYEILKNDRLLSEIFDEKPLLLLEERRT